MRQQLSFVTSEQAQEIELRGREGDRGTVDSHGTPLEVDHEPTEVDDRLRGSIGAAQRCAKTGEELVDAERLRDVVVGARVECGHLLLLVAD